MKDFFEKARQNCAILVFSLPIGIFSGAICFVFSKVLSFLSDFRDANPHLTIPFMPIAGVLIVLMLRALNGKNGENGLHQGMKSVFETARKKRENLPFRLIFFVCASTWLTNLCGGSSGREGVAVQIGACVSAVLMLAISKNSRLSSEKKTFILAGMAAGFSAMFQTPVAAIFFALEVMTVGKIEYAAFPSTVLASFSAYFTAQFLGLTRERFSIPKMALTAANFPLVLKLVVCCMIFSLAGSLFAIVLEGSKEIFAKKFPDRLKGIFVAAFFVAAFILAAGRGRYSGTGANLIEQAIKGESLPLDFFLKFLATVLTLAVGFQGGEVTPLFAMGATLGVLLSRAFGIDASLLAALGYITVFSSATNTFFCPIFIAGEVFGFENMEFYILACFVARLFDFNLSIYDQDKVSE